MELSRCARPVLGAAAAALLFGCGEAPPGETEDAPSMRPEAGFIELEPVEYEVHGAQATLTASSSRARLFFSFHPADERPEEKPLFVLTSGGPGASSAILLGGNTAPRTLDAARTGGASIAGNAASWTAFANLLYVDARGTGFSYGIADGAGDDAARAAEFTVRNFNSFLDAADVVRVTLRFLGDRPDLQARPIVFTGESYAGIRTSLAVHMLHHPDRYAAPDSLYQDAALASEIEAHFSAAGTSAKAQIDRAVLLQPRLTSPQQQAAAGALLEAEGSLMDTVAAETGVPFVRCKDKPAPCSPFGNVLDFLAEAGRDIYDVRRPAGDAFARYREIGARMEDPDVLPRALGADPTTIPELHAEKRGGAYRLAVAAPDDEPLAATFGAIAPYDRYFELELFDLLGAPFAGAEAKIYGIERQHERYGRVFLEDLVDVRFFITNAPFDAAIYTPALPAALALYTDIVESVHMEGAALAVDLRPGAFGLAGGPAREVVFVAYDDAGHSVSLDRPEALSADIAAWLSEEGE